LHTLDLDADGMKQRILQWLPLPLLPTFVLYGLAGRVDTPHWHRQYYQWVTEQAVRQDLIEHLGIDPGDILSTAMGQSGCDLYLSPAGRERFPFGVECKAQERIALPEWWQQCTRNAAAEGLAPLLVFRRNREDALAVLRWADLLALLQNIPANLPEGSDGGGA
ncbi:MAG: hypothetical protein PHI10_07150, partial [Dehalococcoidales bacterium]|nr:hypothetical protein [Dehalococcoidales bacterium]